MADHLAKHRLPHQPACPFCDQAEETIQHVLISCVLTKQVWTLFFQKLSMATLAPHFFRWRVNTIRNSPKEMRKRLNSLIILVAWEVWKFRNACVFGELPLIFSLFCTRSLMNVALALDAFSGWQSDPLGRVL